MTEHHGDPTASAERTLAEQEALSTGRAWLYKGRVIPIISGAEDPPPPDPDPPAAEPPAAPERPEWLEERYGSVEEQAKAYSEAQKAISRQGDELRQMREDYNEMLALMQEQPTPQQGFQDPNQNPLVMEMERAVADGDVLRQMQIQAQLTDALLEQRLEASKPKDDNRGLDPYLVGKLREDTVNRYGADEAMQAKANEIMDSDPLVSERLRQIGEDPNATIGDLAPVVDTAYRLAKAGIMDQEQQSLAQQQAEAERGRQRKIDAETLPSSGTTRVAPKSEQEKTWEEIKNANTGEFRVGLQ